ncbi:MAG: CoA transferase [Chloroflexota bacterium]
MAKILEGIRAVEWAWWHAGPACGYILGDLGAEVIKIEEPGVGDPTRGLTRYMGLPVDLPNGSNTLHEIANRNKKSVTLNLRQPEGRQILYRLVEKSDVFYNNFRQKVRARLGLDYETLKRYNPRLIYATTSGFGQEGPDGDLRAFDTPGVARAGLMHNIGEPGMPPQQMVFGLADQMTASFLAYGIITALLGRERLGIAQEVEVSLFGTMIHGQAIGETAFFFRGEEPPRPQRTKAFNPLVNYYQCADGEWVIFSQNQPQEAWAQFCKALGIEELKDNPRFATTKARGQNCEELIAIIERVIGNKPRSQWLPIFKAHDLIYAPVQRTSDLPHDEQAWANQYLLKYDHPALGTKTVVGFPMKFSETPCAIQREAPQLGQHTEEVLMEVGGYSWDDIARFQEKGLV